MSTRLVIENATVVTVDPDLGDLDRADVLVTDGLITAVGPELGATDAERVDGSGRIVLPGFVDTHRHTWQSAIRHSYGDVDPLTYFREVLGGLGPSYTAEDVRVGTELGAVSALSAGTTTLMDWAHIQNTPDHTEAGIDALTAAGGRAVFGYGWPLTSDGRWTDASALGHPQDIRRLRTGRLASDDQLVTLAMAARGPEMATPEVWRDDLLLARELGLRTSVHVGAYAHNARHHAVTQYDAAGLLGDDLTFVHCGHSSDAEIAAIAAAGATVSLGVQCELNSAGIGDIPLDRLLHHGIRPSLSGDTETKCAGDMLHPDADALRLLPFLDRWRPLRARRATGPEPARRHRVRHDRGRPSARPRPQDRLDHARQAGRPDPPPCHRPQPRAGLRSRRGGRPRGARGKC